MLKPYYEDEWGTIYHGDCREILLGLPKVDLVLTDPPYGVRKDRWDDRLEWNYYVQDWLNKFRFLSSIVIWFCSGDRLKYVLGDRDDFHRLLVWNKPPGTQFAGASHNNIWYSSELILVFGKKANIVQKGKSSEYGFSVFHANTVPENSYSHPTSKPVPLIEWLVQHYSDTNDLILDPFLGSGTTAYCAKKLNRKAIGIEIEEKYCEIAANRCRQMVFDLSGEQ